MDKLETILPAVGATGFGCDLSALLKMQCDADNAIEGDLGGSCELCKNRGYISEIRGKEIVVVSCSCMEERRVRSRIKTSGLERLLEKRTFEGYNALDETRRRAKQAAEKYAAAETDSWFFIGGQTGFGKTHLCIAAAGELLKRHKLIYLQWEEQSRAILTRSGYECREEREEMTNAIKKAEIVYIDDFLRRVQPSQAELSLAFEIINYRYNNALRTLITSEHSLSRLRDIDSAVAGRIAEMCGEYCLNIQPAPGRDYRTTENFI